MSRFRALWQASLNATKRALAWNLEDLIPPSERYIFNFNSKEELKKWHLYSDSEYGGLSSASLEIRDAGNELRGNSQWILLYMSEHRNNPGSSTMLQWTLVWVSGVFSGKLSLDVAEDSKWNISRSGFCGMRSKKIYTENWVNSPGQEEDNSWQAFVFVPRDNWYIAKIPLAQFLPTWRGNVIDVDLEMNPSRIVGMSLSVNAEGGVPGAGSGPGDFQVEINWIKALRTTQ
ncbi:probable complex I intermediate-associated protein 30 isoform X1 [Camellia sinensis]|uniref:probable complex I intermediate-associated protein 30 isoform X1 n=1 Tax=Camellia sinensis TaxID=4442 RepID=UPI001036A6CB|nr:probable complex I intermediate-associated protein 30 isoform X1 [Camellia sinensis]XP_028104041.1 probable complex I intermediate-associated protein 30 isoform X1 [Camellia sinensis]XP_028104042.1 probable complex I intermediate-associated protein 30 isoform X1 [Camellia sinensis]XP_028104043.1 probable complex I intermediate-associated protein 30 isoform X1 [Camellia sinensis]